MAGLRKRNLGGLGGERVQFSNVFPGIIVRKIVTWRDVWLSVIGQRTQGYALSVPLDHDRFTRGRKLEYLLKPRARFVKRYRFHSYYYRKPMGIRQALISSWGTSQKSKQPVLSRFTEVVAAQDPP
jgi:hypothetical protein